MLGGEVLIQHSSYTVEVLVAAYDIDRCGDAAPSNETIARYLLDTYFCKIYHLRLMILYLVL